MESATPWAMSRLPPLSVPLPLMAPVAPASRVPALTLTPPVKLLAPFSARVPAPALVSENPLPLMTPPTVRVLALTVTVRLAPSATAPVPRLSALVPVKAKSPDQDCALLLISVTATPLVLSSVPPARVSVPAVAPAAVLLLRLSVPAESVRPPL